MIDALYLKQEQLEMLQLQPGLMGCRLFHELCKGLPTVSPQAGRGGGGSSSMQVQQEAEQQAATVWELYREPLHSLKVCTVGAPALAGSQRSAYYWHLCPAE